MENAGPPLVTSTQFSLSTHFGSLEHPYGLVEAPVVHVLGPVLATMERSGELSIGFVMANLPYIQSFRSLELPHGLEEAPVVHQLDLDHLGGVIFIIYM